MQAVQHVGRPNESPPWFKTMRPEPETSGRTPAEFAIRQLHTALHATADAYDRFTDETDGDLRTWARGHLALIHKLLRDVRKRMVDICENCDL